MLQRLFAVLMSAVIVLCFAMACSVQDRNPQPKPVRTEVALERPVEVALVAPPAFVAPPELFSPAPLPMESNMVAHASAPPSYPRALRAADEEMPVPDPENSDRYQHLERHGILRVSEAPVSTFSIDVDTGSYSNVRHLLNGGQMPPRDAVRVEEMVNYFPYDYPRPQDGKPFAVSTELAPTPWNPDTLLLRIGIQAADPAKDTLPPANLVFLVDVSGSMEAVDRLPLLREALKLFVDQLRPQDRVSLVTYAGNTRIVLPPTSGAQKTLIKTSIDGLNAGGSTAGAAGIDLAYRMAQQAFIKDGINRILLATDGDFNVGVTRFETLKDMVSEKRKTGISLSTLGFGTDNYNDKLMEQLADAGDGAYSFIDTLGEARKVLVNEFTSSLATVAHDVKIQLEFNPANVVEYRQIGFENRALKREDFNNDKVDAGEIGAGHRVTALYEITLAGRPGAIEPLRYEAQTPAASRAKIGELGFLRLRYKEAHGEESRLMQVPITREQISAKAGNDFNFAAAVAAFGQRLGDDGKYLGTFDFRQIRALAASSREKDPFGYRGEFEKLVAAAERASSKVASR